MKIQNFGRYVREKSRLCELKNKTKKHRRKIRATVDIKTVVQ